MNNLKWASFCLAVPLLLPGAASAGNWDNYLAIYNRFYLLDQQHFNQITCSVSVPVLSEMVRQIRAEAMTLSTNAVVNDTLNDYTLTYARTNGLSIHDPTLVMVPVSVSGEASSADVQQGNKTATLEFNNLVQKLDMQLNSLFKQFQLPKPGEIDIYYVTQKNGTDTVSYGKNGVQVTTTFNAMSVLNKVTGGFGESTFKSNYSRTQDGKLLFTTSTGTLKQAFDTINTDVAVHYNVIGTLSFPSQIAIDTKMSSLAVQQDVHLETDINNCKVQ